jgi:hypothetical protein
MNFSDMGTLAKMEELRASVKIIKVRINLFAILSSFLKTGS